MSYTVTETLKNRIDGPFNILNEQAFKQSKSEIGNKLIEILKKYPTTEWNDDLSLSLHEWSITVLKLALDIENEQTYQTIAAGKLKSLSMILCNFIKPASAMRVPVIDRNQWVWDQEYLDCYLKYSTLSPFDGQVIQTKTHELAQAIMKWKQMLPSQSESFEKDTSICFVKRPLFTKEYMPDIRVLAQVEILKQSERQRAREIERKLIVAEQLTQQIQEEATKILENTRQLHETTNAEVRQKIAEMQKQQQSNLNLLKGQLNALSISLGNANAQLVIAHMTNEKHQADFENLQGKYQNLAWEYEKLAEKAKKNKNSCVIM